MPAKRGRVFFWLAALLALNWLSLVCASHNPPPGLQSILRGYVLGSLFAQATLAAAWSVFGPARIVWRVPLSIVWVMAATVAIGINLALHQQSLNFAVILGMYLIGQWLLLQLPFWAILRAYELQLRQMDEVAHGSTVRVRFGIRHLLIVMVLASVTLGVGPMLLPVMRAADDSLMLLLLLAVAAIVLTVPLLLAALMRRMAIPGVILALALAGLVTLVELPLSESLIAGGPDMNDFIAINIGTALSILIVAGILRLNGYCLCARPASGNA